MVYDNYVMSYLTTESTVDERLAVVQLLQRIDVNTIPLGDTYPIAHLYGHLHYLRTGKMLPSEVLYQAALTHPDMFLQTCVKYAELLSPEDITELSL